MVELLPDMHKALGLVPSTEKFKKKKTKKTISDWSIVMGRAVI